MTVYVYIYIIDKINITMLQGMADISHMTRSVPKKILLSSVEQLNLLGAQLRL